MSKWSQHAPYSLLAARLTVLVFWTGLTVADCDCGYSTSIDGNQYFFTDLIEADFAHLSDISTNTDWIRQAFNVTSEANRGNFSEMYDIANIYTDANSDSKLKDGTAQDGQPTGLDLVVKSSMINDMVPVSEIDSNRTDILYGTFRASMRLTAVAGTCSAFFWYFNDTQEIDMEFLSQEYNATNGSYPVNLVLQSRQAAELGFDAQKTPTFIKTFLPFDPTTDFHEYRIDFMPGGVLFYADNKVLGRMNGSAVPSHSGHLALQHWSNGNPLWSGGPPDKDAVTTVAYVKAYFNSSLYQRQQDWQGRCSDINTENALCTIPEVTSTNDSATGWFFSGQHNMTNNQTVSGMSSLGARQSPETLAWLVWGAAFVVIGWKIDTW